MDPAGRHGPSNERRNHFVPLVDGVSREQPVLRLCPFAALLAIGANVQVMPAGLERAAAQRERSGRLDMEEHCCCDMTGCIAFFEAIDPEVQKIETFSVRSGTVRDGLHDDAEPCSPLRLERTPINRYHIRRPRSNLRIPRV